MSSLSPLFNPFLTSNELIYGSIIYLGQDVDTFFVLQAREKREQ